MPDFDMTPEEANRYGSTLSIWEKLMLLNAWAPLLTFGQRFMAAGDVYAKSVVVSECAEWLASRTDSGLDDELVKYLTAVLRTPEGENLVRWLVMKAGSMKA